MRDTWQLQRAKAELSKLIATSIEKGPQMVTRPLARSRDRGRKIAL